MSAEILSASSVFVPESDWPSTPRLSRTETLSESIDRQYTVYISSFGQDQILRGTGRQDWFDEFISQLRAVSRLPAGWDSYGGRRISSHSLLGAVGFAFSHPHAPAPSIVPTHQGGIVLEWHRKGHDLEVEFDEAGNLTFSDAFEGAWVHERSRDIGKLSSLLRSLA